MQILGAADGQDLLPLRLERAPSALAFCLDAAYLAAGMTNGHIRHFDTRR